MVYLVWLLFDYSQLLCCDDYVCGNVKEHSRRIQNQHGGCSKAGYVSAISWTSTVFWVLLLCVNFIREFNEHQWSTIVFKLKMKARVLSWVKDTLPVIELCCVDYNSNMFFRNLYCKSIESSAGLHVMEKGELAKYTTHNDTHNKCNLESTRLCLGRVCWLEHSVKTLL